MRHELEELRFNKDNEVQKAITGGKDEISQLMETSASLRSNIETLKSEYEQKIHDIERDATNEKAQLTETIFTLRTSLEGHPKH